MNLRWNTSDYGGVKDLRIPPHRIWKPDVLMYNSADEGFDGTYQTNVVVRNNGSCLYVPPGIFKSTCKIDITWFPFDDQRCEMKFGSWTYDGFQVWFSHPCKQGNQEVLNLLKRTRSCYAWPIRIECIYAVWFFLSSFFCIDLIMRVRYLHYSIPSPRISYKKLDLQLQDETGGDISSYVLNGEWELLGE